MQFDFPDVNGKPYKSNGGKMVWNDQLKREIPEGWEVVCMEKTIQIKSGFPFQSSTYIPNGKYQIITIKNVQDGFLDISTADSIDTLPQKLPAYCILKQGNVLISLTGNVGRVGIVFSDNLLLNQRVGYIECKSKHNGWAYLYITEDSVRRKIEKLGIGSAQSNVSPIQIGKIPMVLPPTHILYTFENMVNPILKTTLINANQSLRLCRQRDELLPLLMNGQVSINSTSL